MNTFGVNGFVKFGGRSENFNLIRKCLHGALWQFCVMFNQGDCFVCELHLLMKNSYKQIKQENKGTEQNYHFTKWACL
jgi:hypothetical protein